MRQAEDFVVEWAMHAGERPRQPFVAVRNGDRRIGLYRVKGQDKDTLILSHGGISFPVGTRLILEDCQMALKDRQGAIPALVVGNDQAGMRLAL
ncbi:MAG: hypothetical protein MUC79_04355 [Thiobacillaceae bacterium]|nr:hypothetical protein [Thiobacillaceae bacterium]